MTTDVAVDTSDFCEKVDVSTDMGGVCSHDVATDTVDLMIGNSDLPSSDENIEVCIVFLFSFDWICYWTIGIFVFLFSFLVMRKFLTFWALL